MNRSITAKNNYSLFKEDFKMDTGLDYSTNIPLYISYYNARMNDKAYQASIQIGEILMNSINNLPDTIRLRIAEMISSHDTIKQLLVQ